MPTAFDEQFTEEAIPELLGAADDSTDTGQFGEIITYHPTHAGGIPRAIRAMVTRQRPAALEQSLNAVAPNLLIEVENHHTRGIDATTIQEDDKVMIAEIEGQTPREMSIVNILESDGSRLVLEVH